MRGHARDRGPHGTHKLQGEALAFVPQLVAGQPVRAASWQSWFGRNSTWRYTPGRSSGRSLEKHPDDKRREQYDQPVHRCYAIRTLRAAALGNALQPEARAGLMLFLHTGMCGWAQAVTAMPTFERPSGSGPPNWNPRRSPEP
jgi:hypothetical protein